MAWQLESVNINKKCAGNILAMRYEKLLKMLCINAIKLMSSHQVELISTGISKEN